MKKFLPGIFLGLLIFSSAAGQTFSDSNLPIVVINTDNNSAIVDYPRVFGEMRIIRRGGNERNYLSDKNNPAYLNYEGRISIEIRGSSSQYTDKKQYGFTTLMADNLTNNNIELLGMPAENDWILNSMTFDPATLRDYLTYNLSIKIGEYASRTAYCEVVINGDYKGLYLLQEKIKADDHRVNVKRIETIDNSYPDLTGGYITKADKTTGGDPVAWSMISRNYATIDFIHVLPKPEDVTFPQNDYIRNQFRRLDATALSGNTSLVSGFPSIIDIPSFLDYMIISELSSNADSYTYSTFYHKDRNGKLRAGPIWDNDLTYGNDLFFWGYDRSKPDVWQFSNGDNEGPAYWYNLFNNATFECYLSKRWNELIHPGNPLNPDSIKAFIDRTVVEINEAAVRNNMRWYQVVDFPYEAGEVKKFIDTRIRWITANLGPWSQCSEEPLPRLVISRIMYHPKPTLEFRDADKLEFLELTNNDSQPADLTGIYFGGTGLVFQFPPNSTVGPHESIYLAGDIATFRMKYGVNPFGQFTRNLSDKGEDLVLVDGFGNVIDNVTYSDTIPWPEADGNGSYLKLTNITSDNNEASNWTASNDIILSEPDINNENGLKVFPNPVSDHLYVRHNSPIVSVSLHDLSGKIIRQEYVNALQAELNMASLPTGVYFLKVFTATGSYTKKVIKDQK